MSRTLQTKGSCAYCGKPMTASGMTKHLAACPERESRITAANGKAAAIQPLYHLLVRDRYSSEFWLHLEMNGSAPLTQLDRYLRAIWLECCDHLSKFTVKRWGEEVPKSWTASRAFGNLAEITHLYDFGTTSETIIRLVGAREGKALTNHPIALMSRNDIPAEACMECGARADHFCQQCVDNRDETGFLCAEHAEDHPCDDYGGPIAIVNSPRMGMCGYDGPATPPY